MPCHPHELEDKALAADAVVGGYNGLIQVERSFRSLETVG